MLVKFFGEERDGDAIFFHLKLVCSSSAPIFFVENGFGRKITFVEKIFDQKNRCLVVAPQFVECKSRRKRTSTTSTKLLYPSKSVHVGIPQINSVCLLWKLCLETTLPGISSSTPNESFFEAKNGTRNVYCT
jgi:hypothetical protein